MKQKKEYKRVENAKKLIVSQLSDMQNAILDSEEKM
jgi:hypothetical protein